MKIALLDIKGDDSRKIDTNSSVNIRNMINISNNIGAKFYYNTSMLNRQKYDVVIFGFGSISSEINKTSDFVKNCGASKIFWLVGEYEQSMNPPLFYACEKTGLKFNVIQNYDINYANYGNKCDKIYHLNLNLLITKVSNKLIGKKYDCIYYGRWRKGRSEYFKKYIKNIYLSTSVKNMKQFKHIGCEPLYIDKLSWQTNKETLNLFKYSLYIEDKYTHEVFNNLANRWYEAGICNVVVFFDVNCINTIKKSELAYFIDQIKEYLVSDYESLQNKINQCNNDFEKHLAIQKSWRLSEPLLRNQMIDNLKKIIYGSI